MFTSHKSDAAPRSGQFSADFPATGSSFGASTSESWDNRCFDESLHGAMQPSEQRHRSYSSKRSSVFNLRSRSNTATSTTSTILSLSPPGMSHSETSRPSTPLTLHQHGHQGHTEQLGSRKSLFRGKKGKRLSESVSSSIVVTEYQEKDTGDKRMSVLRKARRWNNQSEEPSHSLKNSISSPFGFQHLTHTDRSQLTALELNQSDKLGSGFRAVRTSQSLSNDLTGANVDELHFNNFSSDNLSAQERTSPFATSFGSPPGSPQRIAESQQAGFTTQDPALRSNLRLSRSVESFSQPGVTLRTHHHSQSLLAPPRLSSLSPLAVIEDATEDYFSSRNSRIPPGRSKRESGVWDSFTLSTAGAQPYLSGPSDETAYVGHALTTPDDTAIQAMTTSFSPSLDDVAEEPERFVRPRAAPQPPMRSPTTPKSPHFDSTIFSNRRSPVTRARNRGNSHTSPRTFSQRSSNSRPVSQSSETLGSSDLVRRGSTRRSSITRRQSNTWRAPEESWEDDVDYIYEHALEADCDFEWDCASDEEPDKLKQRSADNHQTSLQRAQQSLAPLHLSKPSTQYQSRDFRASLLVPNVPDLMPTSAASVSTMDTALRTPYDLFPRTCPGDVGGFMVSPSLLVPQDYKEDQDHTYEDLLNAYADSERHYTMLDPRYSATSSARSRRSSYDSSFISSAQSSGLWSSPLRRSASSAGSVPDLIPSRRTRRDLSFSLVIDHLSDSVASLSHLDEGREDDDVTPPGRALENRTFFPAEEEEEEESQEPTECRLSIQDELKNSLELARQGSRRNNHASIELETQSPLDLSRNSSQRSTHATARHHKQTMSDGAAKLLSVAPVAHGDQPLKSRSRAATSQTVRSPMLSLFPAPPRYSPNLNRM